MAGNVAGVRRKHCGKPLAGFIPLGRQGRPLPGKNLAQKVEGMEDDWPSVSM
jgi:hypothetical protein